MHAKMLAAAIFQRTYIFLTRYKLSSVL